MTKYVSAKSLGIRNLKELVSVTNSLGLPIELSDLDYESDVLGALANIRQPFTIHNYFPRPRKDFTLNLASMDDKIRELAISHVLTSIALCEKFGLTFYGVHGGFRADIPPERLGKQLGLNKLFSYESSYERFVESLKKILRLMGKSRTKLLVENNVIRGDNLVGSGENPLLMCTTDEFVQLFHDIPDDRLGILVDMGHLKVSSKTLGFSVFSFIETVSGHIGCFHLHDNNGLSDDHEPFDKTAWFLPIIRRFGNIDRVLETRAVAQRHIFEMLDLVV